MKAQFQKVLGSGIGIVVLVVLILSVFGVLLHRDSVVKENLAILAQLTINAERVLTADLRSTSAVRLSASLHSDEYLANYQDFQDTKYAILDEIAALPKPERVEVFLERMEYVQQGIEEVEADAIALIDESRFDEALALVTTREFMEHKQVYQDNLAKALDAIIEDRREHAEAASGLYQGMQVSALGIVLLFGLVGGLFTRQLRRSLTRQSELAGHLEEANRNLESRVEERTREAVEAKDTLRAALDNMAGGILLLDADQTIRLFNDRVLELFDLPREAVAEGGALRTMLAVRAERGEYGPGDPVDLVEQRARSYRVDHLSKVEETVPSSGRSIELLRRPTADGGVVAVFNDVTERKAAQAEVESAHSLITDSIRYASRIQRSLLPKPGLLERLTDDHFALWEPRDVVGGDMYWIKEDRRGYFCVLFDCTGHGVPGALMTTIAVSALDVAFTETGDPARLMARVNQIIKTALDQHADESGGQKGESDDGLEMGICLVEPDRMRVTYAGARFDLIHGQGRECQVIRGEKSGIGYRHVDFERKFANHSIRLRPGERFYLYSDGVSDQIGGPRRRAFGRKRLIALINETSHLSMGEQRERIAAAFTEFQGDEPRRDDVSFLGFMPVG